jgi:hypothetical protein
MVVCTYILLALYGTKEHNKQGGHHVYKLSVLLMLDLCLLWNAWAV